MDTEIIIFTDLDGTLLDHDNYTYSAAQPTLDYIRQHNIPLIFTTSKTSIEIEDLCKQTNSYHPFIAENGGLLAIPENYFSQQPISKKYNKHVIGKTRSEITSTLLSLASSFQFKSFNDMSAKELIKHTGLDPQQAIYANQRDCTEPLLWLDDPLKLNAFTKQLEKNELRLVSGGRFHHVMGHHDKATTMITLKNTYEKNMDSKFVSIALGDSPNDVDMLKKADYGIVIPNPHAPKLSIEKHANLSHAKLPGPQGWNQTLLLLLKELLSD